MTLDNVSDVYVLTPMQAGMLFHTVDDPDSGVFVEQLAVTLGAAPTTSELRLAWDRVTALHGALRTAFVWDGVDEPLQVVRTSVDVPWFVRDWSKLSCGDADARYETFLDEDRKRGFEVADAPLLRVTLIDRPKGRRTMVFTFHHIVLDGWSARLVVGDVLDAAAGAEPPARRSFSDYVKWRLEQDVAAAEDRFIARLGGVSATTVAFERLDERNESGHALQVERLSRDTTARLADFARAHGLTVATVLHGVWAWVLSRYSQSDDVVFGSTSSGRSPALSGVEEMIGLFINTLPVRVRIDGQRKAVDALRDLQGQLAQVRSDELASLARIQTQLHARDGSAASGGKGDALFDSIVVFENQPAIAAAIEIEFYEQSNFACALLVVPGPRLELLLNHDRARLSPSAARTIVGEVRAVVDKLVASPASAIDDVRFDPRSAVSSGGRQTYPDRDIGDLIADVCTARSDEVALAGPRGATTYGALLDRARQWSSWLAGRGLQPGGRVLVCGHRSEAQIEAIVGVLLAGGAFVPVHPNSPAGWVARVADAAGASIILDGRDAPPVDQPRGEPVTVDPTESLAYVIFTSGSTGVPKGVQVSHRNIVSSTWARREFYGDPVGRFLLLSPMAFDSSMVGLFWTLTTGGTLVVPPHGAERELDQVGQLAREHRVTHTLCLPSLYGLLLEHEQSSLRTLQVVIVAGEACPPQVTRRHYAAMPRVRLVNEYGPTEATVWCTAHEVRAPVQQGTVPIGRAIANTDVFIVDDKLRSVPRGVAGELCVAGDGVSPGYLDSPEQTRARFVDGLYRTGDRVRICADGTLEFLGRLDEQVKLRGHRVEPGQIEAVIAEHPEVDEAAVVVVESLLDRLGRMPPVELDVLLGEIEGES